MSLQLETSMWQQCAEKLCEVVKLRNKLARAGGFEDFYDYKVQGKTWRTRTAIVLSVMA
jgi:hypothetical protein